MCQFILSYEHIQKSETLPAFKNPVVTIGSFDGIHKGHVKLLNRIKLLAKEYDGEDVVVTFYPHPRSIVFPKDKSLKLLTTLEEKLSLLEKYGITNVIVVPFTVEFSQLSAREYLEKFLIKSVKPKCLVVGYDHRFGLNRDGDFRLLKQYADNGHFDLIEIKQEELDEITISSTKIRKALEEANLEEANLFLGHNYLVSGTIVKGDSIGTSIGFPTANVKISNKDKLIPHAGIYAARIAISGNTFGGMLYIGDRPTLNDNSQRIEVNIFDFNENIYGEYLSIELISLIREDQKFDSLTDLRSQLFLDEAMSKEILNLKASLEKDVSVTIAILNYNGEELLESYLPSVDGSTILDHEILIIDNASTDDSVEYIKEWHPEVRIVELQKNHGFAEGYNIGMSDVKSKYTVLLNSDVLVTEAWLDPIIALMESDKSIGAAQPKIKSLESKETFEYAGAAGGYIDKLYYPFCRGRVFDHVEQDTGQYDDDINVAWVSGAAMVVRTSLFNDLGGFDETYFAHQEEIDFCLRIQKAGYKCVAFGGSEVFHLGGGTLSYENPKKIYLNFRNSLSNLLKNAPFPKLIFLGLMRFILDGVAALKYLLSGNVQAFVSIFKSHVYIYVNLPNLLSKRNNYNKLIRKFSIGRARHDGRYDGVVIFPYYLRGKKLFTQIVKKK